MREGSGASGRVVLWRCAWWYIRQGDQRSSRCSSGSPELRLLSTKICISLIGGFLPVRKPGCFPARGRPGSATSARKFSHVEPELDHVPPLVTITAHRCTPVRRGLLSRKHVFERPPGRQQREGDHTSSTCTSQSARRRFGSLRSSTEVRLRLPAADRQQEDASARTHLRC